MAKHLGVQNGVHAVQVKETRRIVVVGIKLNTVEHSGFKGEGQENPKEQVIKDLQTRQ